MRRLVSARFKLPADTNGFGRVDWQVQDYLVTIAEFACDHRSSLIAEKCKIASTRISLYRCAALQ